VSDQSPTFGIRSPGYRLPDATRPGVVTLQLADIDRSIRYYSEVLGLEASLEGRTAASLHAAGGGEPLLRLREHPGANPVPSGGLLGLYHFALLLPDRPSLGRFLKHLAASGIRAGMSDHLVSEAVYLHDPDGLGIEVYADRPRESWRVEGDQLAMATEPLDVDSVVGSAGTTGWTGMPEGSTVGHIHLFVSDLDLAASFFHEALGLDKIVWSYPGALFMSAGGYHHHLGVNTWARGARKAGADDARLLEWSLIIPPESDLSAIGRSLAAGGHRADLDGDSLLATDPWGTTVRVALGR
jgi:catechol 2,3-dioxygenase